MHGGRRISISSMENNFQSSDAVLRLKITTIRAQSIYARRNCVPLPWASDKNTVNVRIFFLSIAHIDFQKKKKKNYRLTDYQPSIRLKITTIRAQSIYARRNCVPLPWASDKNTVNVRIFFYQLHIFDFLKKKKKKKKIFFFLLSDYQPSIPTYRLYIPPI